MEAPIIRTCRRILLGAVALGALAPVAPASASTGDLAAYVKARAADADGDVPVAVSGYADALKAAPDNVVVAIRAYREAMTAGDLDLVRQAGAVLDRNQVASPDSYLFTLADAVERHDWKRAHAAIDGLADGPLEFLQPSLNAWVAYGSRRGDPIALLDAANDSAIGAHYARGQRALLLIAKGRTDAGLAALQADLSPDGSDIGIRIGAAQLLRAKGKRDEAQNVLRGTDLPDLDPEALLRRKVKPDAAFGIALLYADLMASLTSERVLPLQVLLGRSSLLLEPGDDRTRLLLADALSRDGADMEAHRVLAQIDADSPFARAARNESVTMLTRAGEQQLALEEARRIADAPGANLDEVRDYGDLLVSVGQYGDAAKIYARAIAMAGERAGWPLYLQRGGALEQAGKWNEALPVLRKAQQLAPQQPIVLNYLGYAQIERGENLVEAQKLIEQALRLRPDDPSITDSLGWAYYKRGKIAKAVPLLEKAAKSRPGDVTVNEHLGDAYWRAGRHYEARYAWRAAAVNADGEEAQRIDAKLASGLKQGVD